MASLTRTPFGRAVIAALVLAVLGTAGCGSRIAWEGMDPERVRVVEVVSEGSSSYVRVDGVPGPPFLGVSPHAMAWSPDGTRHAYAATDGTHWYVVEGARIFGPWQAVAELKFTPDGCSLVHAAESDQGWHLVRDGSPGPAYEAIFSESLTLHPSGLVAFAVRDGNAALVIVNGEPGPRFSSVGSMTVAPDGTRVGYVGHRGDQAFLVVGGMVLGPFEAVAEYAWTAPGTEPAFVARREGRWFVNALGREMGPFDGAGSLRVSEDGETWAFVARSSDGDRIVRTQGESPPFERVIPRSLVLDPTGDHYSLIAWDRGGMGVVMNGIRGPTSEVVRDLGFRPDGSGFGYLSWTAEGARAILDGHPGPAWDDVSDLQLGHGRAYAHLARRGSHEFAIVNDSVHRFARVVPGTLVLDAWGEHWVVLASSPHDPELRFWLDGHPAHDPFSWMELSSALIVLASDDAPFPDAREIVQGWARAELRKLTGEQGSHTNQCPAS